MLAAAAKYKRGLVLSSLALCSLTFVYYLTLSAGLLLEASFAFFFFSILYVAIVGRIPNSVWVAALISPVAYAAIQLASLVSNISNYDASSTTLVLVDTANVSALLLAGGLLGLVNLRSGITPLFETAALVTAAFLLTCLTLHWGERFGGRFIGHGLHPNWWGSIAYGASCCAVFVRNRLLRTGVISACVFVCLEASSRGSLLGIAAIVAGMILVGRRISTLFVLLTVVSPVLASALLLSPVGDVVLSAVGEAFQLDNMYRGVGSGFTGRLDGWWTAIDAFASSPLFGIGPNALEAVHNGYLMTIGETGMLGTIFFVGALVSTLVSHRTSREAKIIVLSYSVFVSFAPRTFNLVLGSLVPSLFAVHGFTLAMAGVAKRSRTIPGVATASSPRAGSGKAGSQSSSTLAETEKVA